MRLSALCNVVAWIAWIAWCPEALMAEALGEVAESERVARPVALPGVENAFRATDNIYSGSQPGGDATFAALAQLGVKTIISVDGGKPDVEAARRHGLRTIHLPFGYDGIPANRVAEMVRAVGSGMGPFYVHCHHGKHRGPAAVAVMCLAVEGWSADRAVAWLREAGTAEDYRGLYRAAEAFVAPTSSALAAVEELPEVALSSSLVDAMVAIGAHFDALKQTQKSGWVRPLNHPDISPVHEAMLLWEQFREMARTEDTAGRSVEYRILLAEAEEAARLLHVQLKASEMKDGLDAKVRRIGQNCVECHKRFRNE